MTYPVHYLQQPTLEPTIVPDLEAVHAYGCWGCGEDIGTWFDNGLQCCIQHQPNDVVSRERLREAVERKRKAGRE